MSVVVVVKVSEGLVLAADSAATIQGVVNGANGHQEGVLKTYFSGRKLFQIGDLPLGVLTWGAAFIGSRTIESLVREWEYQQHWQSRADYAAAHDAAAYQVQRCAEGLLAHLRHAYAGEYGVEPANELPGIGVIVAGYSQDEFFPEIHSFALPHDLADEAAVELGDEPAFAEREAQHPADAIRLRDAGENLVAGGGDAGGRCRVYALAGATGRLRRDDDRRG